MPEFQFNTQNHIRIWFSRDPANFLNDENQLRLVRFRHINPNATLTLIYSSLMLNDIAKEKLKSFCSKHNFIPLDFDEELINECIDSQDKTLYELAKDELDAFNKKEGGSLAAASDMVRLIAPLLAKGTYSDFDTNINVKALSPITPINAPIIFNLGSIKADNDLVLPLFNNDIMGVATVDGVIHPDAKVQLQAIQHKIINNYQSPVLEILNEIVASGLYLKNPLILYFSAKRFDIFISQTSEITVIKFRSYLNKLSKNVFSTLRVVDFPTLTGELSSELKNKLQTALCDFTNEDFPNNFSPDEKSKIMDAWVKLEKEPFKQVLSNPWLLLFLPNNELQQIISKYNTIKDIHNPDDLHKSLIQLSPLGMMNQFLKDSVCLFSGPFAIQRLIPTMPWTLQQMSFEGNNLFDNYNSNQSLRLDSTFEKLQEMNGHSEFGIACDASWLPQGYEQVKKREIKLHHAARQIQSFWRKHQSPISKNTGTSDKEECLNLPRKK